MKKQLITQALLLSFITVGLFAYSQEAVQLKYNFVKGKTYVLSTQVENTIIQSMGGQEMKMETEITATNGMKIEDVDKDGNATTLITFISTKVHSVGMGQDTTMTVNGSDEQKRVVFAQTGRKISEVKLGDPGKGINIGSADQFSKFITLPANVIKTGDKWNDKTVDTIEASQQNPVNINTTSEMAYLFAGKEQKDGVEYLKITYTGVLAITGKGNQMGMDLFLEGTGKTEGFSYFDPKTSMVVYSEGNTELDMTVAVAGQQNMTMPMTQRMKTISKFEEKK